jgi:hypothetical protein
MKENQLAEMKIMTINFQSRKNAPWKKTLGFCLFGDLFKTELLFRKNKGRIAHV